MAEAEEATGGDWFRVCLNTIVRKGKRLESERIRILPMGSRVYVTERNDRRVRITHCDNQRIDGWCSITSSNGDTILSKVTDEEVKISKMEAQEREKVQEELKNNFNKSIGALTAALNDDDQEQMKNMTQQLHDLKSQVDDAAKKKKALEQLKKKNAEHNNAIKEQEDKLAQLKKEYEQLENSFHGKVSSYAKSENDQLNKLAKTVEDASKNKQTMESNLQVMKEEIERQQQQNQENKKKLQDFLLASPDNKKKKPMYFRPQDVLFTSSEAPCGAELVIIKYYGEKPKDVELIGKDLDNCEKIVGVERELQAYDDDMNEITHQGQGVFNVSPNRFAMWLDPAKHCDKILSPEALVKKLQMQLQRLIKATNAKD